MTQRSVLQAVAAVLVPLVILTIEWPSRGAETPPARDDQRLIQGNWECIASIKDGKQVSNFVGVQAAMEGDRLTWTFPQPSGRPKIQKAVFRLDPQQNPKHFDWYVEEKPNEIHKRLYILEGDVLIWSANLGTTTPRPESFSAGQWQFVMRRLK